MKKFINTSLLLFIGNHFLLSQSNHGTTSKNYIYEKNCLDESCVKKIENIQYLDGLNRPQQIISIKATPQGNDMIIPFEYDNYGVQSKRYLPIPQTSTGNGSFNTSPTSNGSGFYGTSNFYSEFVHDGSILTKVSEQSGPGDAWTLSSGKTQKSIIDINKNSDNVKKYMINVSWDDTKKVLLNSISKINLFNEGELYKTIVTDEDNNRTITFKNKLGKTLLIRKENNNAGNIVNLDTYYVYNFYNQLVYVIPPLAAVKTVIDQSTLDNLCYQYKYDVQGRLVEKKLPGKGLDTTTGVWRWDSFVYDQANRLILTQDPNLQQQGKWMVTKYDGFGRVLYTGTIPGGDRTSMQNQAGNLTVIESKDITGFAKNGMQVYYTNGLFAGMDTILSVNYYDTYPQGTPPIPSSILNQAVLSQNALNSSIGISTQSLPTASYVKNIEDDSWTKNYTWYDTKGRAIGSHSVNDLGGYTKIESELGFAGEVKKSYTYHKRTEYDEETIIKESFVYDNQNRLTIRKHQVNSNPEEILAVNNYNELSQLRNKQIGGTGNNPIQTVDYTYNIRGWLTGINNPTNLNNDLFGYSIKYNNPESSTLGKFNGNIAQIDWKASDDGTFRRYDYKYDSLDRLLSGVYSEPGSFVPANNFYNESLTYDLSGNIISLLRKAKGFSQTEIKIDDLAYTYTGNRLDSVTDSSANYSGYPDVSGNLISYDFNGNMKDHIDKGILQIDYNLLNLPKYIKFDQTYVIRNPFGGSQQTKNITTRYTYRANGTKLRKVYTYGISKNNSEANKVTEYYDGFQYDVEGASSIVPPLLKFVPTAEGYYDFVQGKYIYQYKDQVGNIRLAYYRDANNNTKIDRTANFYPFGMEFSNSSTGSISPNYNYSFQGQEKQTDTNWNSFKWRNYDPTIGRFFNIDPFSEKYAYQSHYNFSENRVVNAVELEGLESVDIQWSGYDYSHGDTWNALHFNWDISFSWGEKNNSSSDNGAGAQSSSNIEIGFPLEMSENEFNSWEADGKSYEQITSNTLITRNLDGSNPTYNFILPQNFGGWGQDETGSDGLIWKGCLSCHADNGAFTYAVHNSQENNAGQIASAILSSLLGSRIGSGKVSSSSFSGSEKAWAEGATPNSIYTYLSSDAKTAVSNYIYNYEGKVIFQVDFQIHGKSWLSGHGHDMTAMPGNLGIGHLPVNHVPHGSVPSDFKVIPNGINYSVPLAK